MYGTLNWCQLDMYESLHSSYILIRRYLTDLKRVNVAQWL